MSRRAWGLAASLLLLGSLSTACFSEHTTAPAGGGVVSFANDIQPILSGSCAFSNCHGTNANPGGRPMVLTTGQSYANMVGVFAVELTTMQRIRAGEPDNSYLIHKIQGTHRGIGGSGERMPLSGSPLSQTQINLFRSWVAKGALRN
jgi:hypothetical protein